MVPKWRRVNVDATSSRRIDINTTSFEGHVPAGMVLSPICSWRKEQHDVMRIRTQQQYCQCQSSRIASTFISTGFD